MNPDFDAYRLSDEHEALREAVRALAEKEIAPYAAEVDDQGRYPTEARDALVKAGFHAITIPEEYGAISFSASARTASRSASCSSLSR